MSNEFLAGSKTTAGIGIAILLLGGSVTALSSDTTSNFQEVRGAVRTYQQAISSNIQDIRQQLSDNKVLILRSEARILKALQQQRSRGSDVVGEVNSSTSASSPRLMANVR